MWLSFPTTVGRAIAGCRVPRRGMSFLTWLRKSSALPTAEEVLAKIRQYFQAGCLRVWVVYPVEEQIYVYQSPTQIRVLTRKDDLEGEDFLPGFRLPLGDLFEEAPN
jgi:hypothetical protein